MTGHARPQPGPPRPYRFPREEHTTLANGLELIVAPVRRVPVVSVLITVDAGGEIDALETAGAACLTAKALAEGAGARDADALADAFADLGSELHAEAGWSKSEFGCTVTAPVARDALALLGSVITTPMLPHAAIARLREERLAELTQLEAEPRNVADDTFAEAIFTPESRYGRPADGDRQGVTACAVHHVEELYRTRYVPRLTRLLVVGDVDVSHVVQATKELLETWQRDGAVAPRVLARPATSTTRLRVVHRPHAEQAELRIGHVTVPRNHPDYFPLIVMNAVLGGLFNARINMNLRERHGYTYGAFSTMTLLRHGGLFEVSTAVRSDVTGAAAREILHEIDRIRTSDVTESERALAVDYMTQVFPIRFETTAAIADAIATRESLGVPRDYYDRYRDCIREVSVADIRRAADTHLSPAAMHIAVVGDREELLPQLEPLAASL